MNYVKLVILVFIFVVAVSFAENNTQRVTLSYYFNWETSPFPMYLLMFIPFFIGTVVGSLVGFSSRLGLKDMVKKLRNSNEDLKEKLKKTQEAHIVNEYATSTLEENRVDTG